MELAGFHCCCSGVSCIPISCNFNEPLVSYTRLLADTSTQRVPLKIRESDWFSRCFEFADRARKLIEQGNIILDFGSKMNKVVCFGLSHNPLEGLLI